MDVNIEYNKLLSLYAGNSLISSLIREDFVDAAMLNDRAGSVKKIRAQSISLSSGVQTRK